LSEMSLGKCFASNEVLADYMGKKTTGDYVIRLLKKLEDKGYIIRVYDDDTKLVRKEIVPLVRFGMGGETIQAPRPNDTLGGGETILNKNNTTKSNIKEYITHKVGSSNSTELPDRYGKTPLSRLKTCYEKLYMDEFSVKPRVFLNGRDGGVLKSLLKEYSEVQVAAIMITHFNWYGADGKNDWDHVKLEKAAFPITWISPNLNPYINYINGSYQVDFLNAELVLKFVRDYLKKLST